MTELITKETIYEQIPTLVFQLRQDADERVEFITADLGLPPEAFEFQRAGGTKQYFDPGQKKSAAEKVLAEVKRRKESAQIQLDEISTQATRDHYLQEIRPFLADAPNRFQRNLFRTRGLVSAYFNHLRTILPIAAQPVLTDLEEICEERRQLALQQRLHRWLHGWLYVHVPLSFAFLVLVIVHAVLSLRY